jgi:hypothetical protein
VQGDDVVEVKLTIVSVVCNLRAMNAKSPTFVILIMVSADERLSSALFTTLAIFLASSSLSGGVIPDKVIDAGTVVDT